jgi:hypothetical protein
VTFLNFVKFLRRLVFAEDSAFFYASMTNRDGSHIEAIAAACFLLAGMGGRGSCFAEVGRWGRIVWIQAVPQAFFLLVLLPWLAGYRQGVCGSGGEVNRLSGDCREDWTILRQVNWQKIIWKEWCYDTCTVYKFRKRLSATVDRTSFNTAYHTMLKSVLQNWTRDRCNVCIGSPTL